MKSKYIVLAITFLLALSSSATIVTASNGKVLAPAAVDTHGPRISQIDFSVISVDSALSSTLGSGGIQVAEWSFLAGTFASLKSNSAVSESKNLAYTEDGIAFNNALPIIGNVHYHLAIQYLTNYGSIQSVSLSGIGGLAGPYNMPCQVFPTACNNKVPIEKYNLVQAAVQLSQSGAFASMSGSAVTTAQIAKLSSSKLASLSWFSNAALTQAFNPLFYYRSDDPLRSSVATLLVTAAKSIGLVFNAVGITDAEAGGDVYGPSEGIVIQNGGYCASGPNAGTNDCPPAILNETSAALATDNWAMYTYGWASIGPAFTFSAGYQWTSSQINNDNFESFINSTMDRLTNTVFYASSLTAAEAAAKTVDLVFAQQLPAVIAFYENLLEGVYVSGWTGFANIATYGPTEGTGAYYSFLNVQKQSGLGGTLNYAVHGVADIGSLNPIAYPNWEWQADLYQNIYDGPLATPPAQANVANAYIAYQTTGTDPTAPAGSVQIAPGVQSAPFTGLTPVGSFNFQNPDTSAQANIVNGQAITFTFMDNITFTDNVPLTAYDMNASLYYLDVAVSPGLPTDFSPFIGAISGPLGLWATTVTPPVAGVNGGSITMYVNDTSVWNIITLDVPILPAHLFNYLNVNVADAFEANIDFSMPYGAATAATPGSAMGTAPASITYLPNINLGAGPFWLNTIDEATGSGILTANVNYYRAAWFDNLKANTVKLKGGTISLTSYPSEYTFNAGSSTNMSLAAGATGYVNMTTANLQASNGGNAALSGMTCSATAQLFKGSVSGNLLKAKATGSPITLTATCNGNGQIVVSITPGSVTGMTKGIYEITVQGSYTYLGEARTWFQFFGIQVK